MREQACLAITDKMKLWPKSRRTMVGIQYVPSIYAALLRIEGYDEYGGGGSLIMY